MKNAGSIVGGVVGGVPGASGRPTAPATREQVVALLLHRGASTAADLAEVLGVSPAAVRKHLDALLHDGVITTRAPRRRVVERGRPARHYVLTDAGHAAGPARYDDLALDALRFLAESGGSEAVERFAQERAQGQGDRYARAVDVARAAGDDPVAALAEALSADGYAAAASPHGTGTQLCQHHCPVQHVAAAFPQICDAETAALGQALGVHVQRLATIAHGDGVCTTFVPSHVPSHVPPVAPAPPAPTTPSGRAAG